ncbi:MAG TPA: phosphoglucosamine mutase [Actinomycetota bacterium]|nr:phosphoglucosamine mutase [Actinomycetota bacterium]
MGRLFGTDGIRGRFGRELTTDLARGLGRAAVLVLSRYERDAPRFLIGRDTRASGEPLEAALVEGIVAAGGDVTLVGVEPTPAIAFLTTALSASSGVVISASHHPPEDNGIKFFGPYGFKLSDDLEEEIEKEMEGGSEGIGRIGTVRELPSDAADYVEHVVAAAECRLDGMRVVVDCANGAASHVAPEALRRLGAEVEPIFAEPDGANINVGCGALHPEVVAGAVRASGADVGIAHDGDADRALFADADGNVIDGDQVLAACAVVMKEEGRLDGNIVVATVMSNLGLRLALERAGIRVIQAAVGDRYVLEQMQEHGAVLGGEQSGHIIFRDHATTGDGLVTAARFLSFARRRGQAVAELASVMRRLPQVLENVRVSRRDALEEAEPVWAAVRAAESELGETGRVLVRPSGTEPLVRVMVEAASGEEARRHARAIADVVERELG